jgi:hypothetical protein
LIISAKSNVPTVSLQSWLTQSLAHLGRDVADLVDGYLAARGAKYRRSDDVGRVIFDVEPSNNRPDLEM